MISFRYKTIFFFILLSSFLLLLYGKYHADKVNAEGLKAVMYFPVYLDKRLQNFSIMGPEEKILNKEYFSDGIFFLHFWATWCKSCEEELRSISRSEENNSRFLCISVDERREDAIQYVRQRELNINLFFDRGGEAARSLGSTKFPETYVVKNGRIILKFEGPRDWDNSSFIDFIHKYLERY